MDSEVRLDFHTKTIKQIRVPVSYKELSLNIGLSAYDFSGHDSQTWECDFICDLVSSFCLPQNPQETSQIFNHHGRSAWEPKDTDNRMLCFSAFSNRIIVEVLMYILAEYRERYPTAPRLTRLPYSETYLVGPRVLLSWAHFEYRSGGNDITCLEECISNSQKGSLIYMRTGAALSHLNSSCIRTLEISVLLSGVLLELRIPAQRGQQYWNGGVFKGTSDFSKDLHSSFSLRSLKVAFTCLAIFITLHFICEYTRITTLIVKSLPRYACKDFKRTG